MERYNTARPQAFSSESLLSPAAARVPITRSRESLTTGRYDYLRARYDEPLKRLENLRQRLHPAPLDKSLPEPRYLTRCDQ